LGIKTNNQAEFHALLFTLVDAYVNGMRKIKLFGDSKLVVDSINGKMKVSNLNIVEYYESVKKIIRLFAYWKIEFVERKYNTRADKLSNLGLKAAKKKR
jgi:ribonuclease HI